MASFAGLGFSPALCVQQSAGFNEPLQWKPPRPRPAVLKMAAYTPPTARRADKLRLDFNENTVGCSPRVIEFLKQRLDAGCLAIYPEYGEAKAAVAEFFGVALDRFIFTNGTDEAIQVFINTYVDDGQEVLLLRPAYAMYRFYAEVAGASIREIEYSGPAMDFPLAAVLDAITPATRAVLIANPNNPTGTGLSLPAIERILKRARKAAVFIDEAYFEFSGDRLRSWGLDQAHAKLVCEPHVFQGVRDGGDAAGLPVLASGQHRLCAQGAIAL